jgi:hypothetical protein
VEPSELELGRAGAEGEDPRPTAAAVAIARRIYRGRAEREAILGPGLFADPAWDMLLDLTICQGRRRLAVSAVCLGSRVAHATGMRHLGLLLDQGLVERSPDPSDRRRTYIRLTSHGMAAMEAALMRFA